MLVRADISWISVDAGEQLLILARMAQTMMIAAGGLNGSHSRENGFEICSRGSNDRGAPNLKTLFDLCFQIPRHINNIDPLIPGQQQQSCQHLPALIV